jgi:hypothetical protein
MLRLKAEEYQSYRNARIKHLFLTLFSPPPPPKQPASSAKAAQAAAARRLRRPGGCGGQEAAAARRLRRPGGCGGREAAAAGSVYQPGLLAGLYHSDNTFESSLNKNRLFNPGNCSLSHRPGIFISLHIVMIYNRSGCADIIHKIINHDLCFCCLTGSYSLMITACYDFFRNYCPVGTALEMDICRNDL